MGVQFGTYPDARARQTPTSRRVDGNYGFGDGCFDGDLDATDPSAPEVRRRRLRAPPGAATTSSTSRSPTTRSGNPIYKFTREEDINIGNGDQFVPQVPPPACAGAFHPSTSPTIGAGRLPGHGRRPSGITSDLPVGVDVPASTPIDNPTFVDIGGSPYEGQPTPLCDTKLVTLQNGKSVVPTFNVFTDVPLPGPLLRPARRRPELLVRPASHCSTARRPGVPFAPVGIYDYANRLVTPSSPTTTASSTCCCRRRTGSTARPRRACARTSTASSATTRASRALNPNYNPQFRTIAAEFEAMPGLIIPADLAPTQVGVSVQLPGSQPEPGGQLHAQPAGVRRPHRSSGRLEAVCRLGSWPRRSRSRARDSAAAKGTGQVTLDGVDLPTDHMDRSARSWCPCRRPIAGPASTGGQGRQRPDDRQRPDIPCLERPSGTLPTLGRTRHLQPTNAIRSGPTGASCAPDPRRIDPHEQQPGRSPPCTARPSGNVSPAAAYGTRTREPRSRIANTTLRR